MLFMFLDELPSCSDDKGVYEVLRRTVIQCNASAALQLQVLWRKSFSVEMSAEKKNDKEFS